VVGDCVDVVSIQHAYGIWGGEDGDSVLDFAGALTVPAVATLHTIHRDPSPRQRRILTELVDAVAATVVMSPAAATLMVEGYGADPARLVVIAHGVPDLPLVAPSSIKPAVGMAGHELLLGFGLLGPGKGHELVIDALPAIVAAHPDVMFAIVGVTHSDIVGEAREAYRAALTARAATLGVSRHVQFVDRFVGRVELTRWLQAADIVVTPYRDLDQIVAGTLATAMGAGRAIVSTPYAHAVELLADDRGVLVAPDDVAAMAATLIALLDDDDRRAALGERAYAYTREMTWSAVGTAYRHLFDRVTAPPSANPPLRPGLTILNA
jgi:glycosyltransferase involved in cell wall biosynthesis